MENQTEETEISRNGHSPKENAGIQFDLPGVERKNPLQSVCKSSCQQDKPYLNLSQNLTMGTLFSVCIHNGSAR